MASHQSSMMSSTTARMLTSLRFLPPTLPTSRPPSPARRPLDRLHNRPLSFLTSDPAQCPLTVLRHPLWQPPDRLHNRPDVCDLHAPPPPSPSRSVGHEALQQPLDPPRRNNHGGRKMEARRKQSRRWKKRRVATITTVLLPLFPKINAPNIITFVDVFYKIAFYSECGFNLVFSI